MVTRSGSAGLQAPRPIIVRWTLQPTRNTCHACTYLARIGIWRLDAGPQTPFHEHCHCRRLVIPTGNMSAQAFANLVAQADRNGARAGAIETRARTLLHRD